MKKQKVYLASEWLKTCNQKGNQAARHDLAYDWYFVTESRTITTNGSYQEVALLAESAEWSERAAGLKPVRIAPIGF